MTQEEKAKAYDEAMNKIKPLYEQAKRDGNPIWSTYEYLFPQLHKEEKPLTPFQQCLNCILRGAYYAEVPDEKVNEFILSVVRTRTDELIKLAKKHEYTDCQLHKSEDEKMMQEFNDWLCEEIECRTSSLCDEKDRKTLNMLCYILSKTKNWLEKQKEQKPVERVTDAEMEKGLDELTKFKQFASALSDIYNIIPSHSSLRPKDIDWNNFCAGLLTYLKRNQPAEWGEEDETRLTNISLCSKNM